MNQDTLTSIIEDQTRRALWEVRNVIDCIPDTLWDKHYCDMPCWKHVYHMLHSLDLWYINPRDRHFQEPDIHEKDLNNLDIPSSRRLSRKEITSYFSDIEKKILSYLSDLTDERLKEYPTDCEYSRFTLILAQFRHLHSHMGMLMGFIIDDTGLWPRVLGLENPFPEGDYSRYL
ncbi:MAG TPA: DinB family protein [Candidatus Eisenbergiella merdavium]|uniref:DinB family protein n=2 Tax=Eisenbergiella TaxID=1432051 RepID=A0A9D2SEG0_9FIRM|nr:DinB family protein [Candidatus Eisenbergiella merdigallinarum]HJC22247.1 DinB family protein [Candidatus Eisenbergiella merdavium]